MEMKRIFFNQSIVILASIIFSLHACGPEKSKEEIILGEWNAHWETTPDESFPDIKDEHLKMNGIIRFADDGKVEISAYGFDGCIFSDDTLTNILNWKLEERVLRFIDNDDDHGLPYNIVKFNSKELQLSLLEDINLTLSRN